MNYVQITKHNLARIRKRLEVETNKLGIVIDIERTVYVDDGMNGKVPNGTISIYNGKAIVINNPNANRVVIDGGRTMNITGTLLVMYDDNLTIKTNDIVTIGDRKYNVIDCVNVDNLNVYYNISLDGALNEENGYE